MSRWIGIALIVATTASWGGAWVTARAAAHDAPATWMAAGRFLIAALALLPVAWLLRRPVSLRHDRRTWWHLAGMALTGAIGYNLFFLWGIERAPASDGAVITPGLSGFMGALWVWAIDGLRPRRNAILGGLLAMAGAALIGAGAWTAAGGPDRIVGILLFVGSSVVWGAYTAIGRRVSGTVSAAEGVFWATALAFAAWAPLAWWLDGSPQADWAAGAYWNMAYLGVIGTAVGFVTWYLAVARLGADRAGPGLGLVPFFGVTFAVVFLDEALRWTHWVGGAVVVLGIVLSNRPPAVPLRTRYRMAASAEPTWEALQDFGGMARWSPDLASSELVEGDGLHPGATRELRFAQPRNGIESVQERVLTVGDRSFDYELVGGFGPYGRAGSRWRVEADGDGCTVTVESTVADGPWWTVPLRPLVHRTLRAGIVRALRTLDDQLGSGAQNNRRAK